MRRAVLILDEQGELLRRSADATISCQDVEYDEDGNVVGYTMVIVPNDW